MTTTPATTSPRLEELGRIIRAYSQVTDKLQRSHDRLEQTVRHLRDELSEKNRQLERRNRLAALGEMAAGMAHEIRNPLGGIQLYASMLANDLASQPGPAELVRKIAGGVKRLEGLVSSVLQFTREINVNPAPADLAQLVAGAMEMAQPRADAAGVRLDVAGPDAMPVHVDGNLISQALLNLVLNAIEAIGGAGVVTVRYGPVEPGRGKIFTLCVSDSGPGIEPRILDRIFNPFFTTKETGTGLGLAMVHRIVDAHEGTITASNGAAGGARFEMTI